MTSTDLSRFDLAEGHLAYLDTGEGDLVVLLHGGGVDHRMWRDQIPHLARTHRVIAPDLRNHGASADATTPFRHCDDVAALVRHLDSGPATLVGLSMGGGAATDTALEHPEVVSRIVVSGTGTSEPIFTDPWVFDIFRRYQEAIEAMDVDAWLDATALFVTGPDRTSGEVRGDVVERVRAMGAETVTAHVRPDVAQPLPVTGSWDRLPEIEIPVLAVVGAADAPDHIAMGRRLAEDVQHGRVVEVAGTAHYPNMERPDEWNTLVDEFLAAGAGV